MGQRIYKIKGLKESAWYEVKISYPASIPASFSLELKKNLTEQKVPIGRRLLNTEKIIFKFDRNNWNSGKDEAFVLVIVEPAGVVAKPNVQNEEFVMFNIICEELAVGIPHRAWWVGITALLCLLLAAVIPYYLPPQLLLRIQDMVWQAGFDAEEKSQPVLTQMRPLDDAGVWILFASPEGRKNPPSVITGWPTFGAAAGHTSNGQLFLT